MFDSLQRTLHMACTTDLKHDKSKCEWIALILKLFCELNHIDHDVNKLFQWLLSETQQCYTSFANRDINKLNIYLTALLSALRMATDRKQEVQGLEHLLNDICLPLIVTPFAPSNVDTFSISLQIAEYLCKHTDAVWSVCAQFVSVQLDRIQRNTIPKDENEGNDDIKKGKITVFHQLCDFILMLLECTNRFASSLIDESKSNVHHLDANQISKRNDILRWIEKVHSLCGHDTFLWTTSYLKVLCKTIWFHLFAKDNVYRIIPNQHRLWMTQHVLKCIATKVTKHENGCHLQMEHFLILQWIAKIRFDSHSIDESVSQSTTLPVDHSNDDLVAQYLRDCIIFGLKSRLKVMEKICIGLLHHYHTHIVSRRVPSECISAVVVLWNAMYEERAKTVSNMLSVQIPKILALLQSVKSEHRVHCTFNKLESTKCTMNSLDLNSKSTMTFDAVQWIQSILDLIWRHGLEHQNKSIRRGTLYCLLSWDFTKTHHDAKHSKSPMTITKLAPFRQSFLLNDFLISMNRPLFFRKSHYDISRQRHYPNTKVVDAEKTSPRPVSWQNTSGKCEDALSTKSPPEGFGFLIESFLTNYVIHFVRDSFAVQLFISEFIVAVCSKMTKFYALYHLLNFLGNLPSKLMECNQSNRSTMTIMNAQTIKVLTSLMTNVMAKFGPLYRSKITPSICRLISSDITSSKMGQLPPMKMDLNHFDFIALCKLVLSLPRHCISADPKHEGYVILRQNWNRNDWLSLQILSVITECKKDPVKQCNAIQSVWYALCRMFEFCECTKAYQSVMEIIFEFVSRAYSAPYQCTVMVTCCMKMLCHIMRCTELHPVLFAKHRKLLREHLMKTQVMEEVMSFILDQQLQNADFREIRTDSNSVKINTPNHSRWVLEMASYLIRFYGDHPTVRSSLTTRVEVITNQLVSTDRELSVDALPSLFVLTHCLRYQSQVFYDGNNIMFNSNDQTQYSRLLMRLISMRMESNLRREYTETLHILTFYGIHGILQILSEAKDHRSNRIIDTATIPKDIARQAIQFSVDCLDIAQHDVCGDMLRCIYLLLPFAKLSCTNLKILSDAAWHILSGSTSTLSNWKSDTSSTTNVVSHCIDLLLFPLYFNDPQMHSKPDGHLRNLITKAMESRKSTVLQPIISHLFVLWFEYPNIATLYVDEVVSMCHSVYHEKIFDPEDRIHRDEYLFAALLLFLSMMFQQQKIEYNALSESHQSFKSAFVESLCAMMERECEVPHLDIIHQRTWNVLWHISPFICTEYGFTENEMNGMMRFLCDLCFSEGRCLSSNQRQWITLSIVRIVTATPKYIEHLLSEYEKDGVSMQSKDRKPNCKVWWMYAVGRCALNIASHQSLSVKLEFKVSTLQRVISILAPCLCSNFGLVRTSSQYFFYETVTALKSLKDGGTVNGSNHDHVDRRLDDITERMYRDLAEIPDAIKLRKRLKATFEWLEQGELAAMRGKRKKTKRDSVTENVDDIKCEEKMEEEIMVINDNGKESTQNVLENQLRVSRERAISEMESFRDDIVEGIILQHPTLDGNEVIGEIVWLIQNREGMVGFTEQMASALSGVMLECFEWYTVINAKKYGEDKQSENVNANDGGNDDGNGHSNGDSGYQRKLDPMLMEFENLVKSEQLEVDRVMKADRRKPFGDVIVVTSLLEKATNLGGICRTSEIFGVKQMVVHDKRVLKRDDFKNLSVTSQDWLPIEAVPRMELIGYLRTMREEEKYCIVGLEQTTNSVKLNEMDFTALSTVKKCVIVVGRERTGLPPDIINQCDLCIEIPQFGILRSLNAHVSFAITLWEFVRQNM